MQLPVERTAPSFQGTETWLNSEPQTLENLRGKVVLVDFWTYTCINWRRTLPYLRAWSEKYRDHGLVVIGVHTPEFSFEKDLDNLRRAVTAQGIAYPVAVDSEYAVWRAFDNHYWPAVYLVDAQGRLRHHQFGEGDYDKLELAIQKLLVEAGTAPFPREGAAVEGLGAEASADWKNLRSPETYVGSGQGSKSSQWRFEGAWKVTRESAVSNELNGKIVYRFHARDVHLVMGASSARKAMKFRVTLDGQPPGESHGIDVGADGYGTLDHYRMYHLIRQTNAIKDRQFEVEFYDAGAEVFVFTFG